MAICTKCGERLWPGATNCGKCGTPTGAAAHGNAVEVSDKDFDEAVRLYKDQQYDKAQPIFEKLAKENHAGAQNMLGTMYILGQDADHRNLNKNRALVDKETDDVKAVGFFRKAAEQGYAPSQYTLGFYYQNGIGGVEKDITQAIEWYRKAADQGNANACYAIGTSYEEGEGVTQDKAKAAEWYSKASVLFQKDADQGNADAQYMLGNLYEYGDGVPQDYAKAAEWWRKAAEQGNYPAERSLAALEAEGKST